VLPTDGSVLLPVAGTPEDSSCSGHGFLSTASNLCVCNTGFFGTLCELARSPLASTVVSIGVDGGDLAMRGASLQIPTGALTTPVDISGSEFPTAAADPRQPSASSQDDDPVVELGYAGTPIVVFGPKGLQFDTPAVLQLPFDKSLTTTPAPFLLNPETGEWGALPSTDVVSVDTAAGLISVHVWHFSSYSAFVPSHLSDKANAAALSSHPVAIEDEEDKDDSLLELTIIVSGSVLALVVAVSVVGVFVSRRRRAERARRYAPEQVLNDLEESATQTPAVVEEKLSHYDPEASAPVAVMAESSATPVDMGEEDNEVEVEDIV